MRGQAIAARLMFAVDWDPRSFANDSSHEKGLALTVLLHRALLALKTSLGK